MVPTRRRAASRGNWVSVSSVMTYLIEGSTLRSPIIAEKSSPVVPRSRALKSVSLPRLRS